MNELTEMFSKYLTAWAMSKAILEDYSETVAKLENTTPEIVKERIMKKTELFFEQGKIKPKDV
jgi:hypothetical protein